MNHRDNARPDGIIGRSMNSAQNDAFDGRFLGLLIGRVTDNKDPDKQRRVKVKLQFQSEDGAAEMQTGWLWQVTNFAGPTDMRRGRRFGVDWPLPEVGSLVCVFFNGGNLHDGYYWGQPRYWEGNTGAPELDKDKHADWNFRLELQNGYFWGIDTHGNETKITPGNFRHRIMVSAFFSAADGFDFMASKLRHVGLSVLRLIGVTYDQTNYPREDEHDEVTEMGIDAMSGTPGYKDPGIKKIEDIEE